MKRFIVCLLSYFILSVGLYSIGACAQESSGEVGSGSATEVGSGSATEVGSGPETGVGSGSATGVGSGSATGDVSLPATEVGSGTATRDNGTLWEEANAAYYANDFASAAALYDSIERSGMVSAKLYYNKAGALFKMGKTGEAILYYNKAQRLAPSDADIAHNLEIASSHTRNRIEPIPEFFLKSWMRSFAAVMSGNGWAWLSIATFALTLAGALMYLLPIGRRIRKTGFYGGLAAFVLFVFAFSFARNDYRETAHPTGGIVTKPSAAVKSSPDSSGTDLFLLYEGDGVRVLDTMNDWSEIVVANGNRGWIRSAALSMID